MFIDPVAALLTLDPDVAVTTLNRPLLVATPCPDVSEMEPPLASVLSPDASVKRPAAEVSIPVPTTKLKPPPDADAPPDSTFTLPLEPPEVVTPDFRMIAPLTPSTTPSLETTVKEPLD